MIKEVGRIEKRLQKLGNKQRAKILKGFFKTGHGDYGEGDIFMGIRVPTLRKLAKEYQDIPSRDVRQLLKAPIHEERMLALLILARKYSKGTETEKERIYELYLKNTRFINNWDLVDVTAEHIVGNFLMNRSRVPLYSLAKSKFLWDRRISIMSTFHFIKHHDFFRHIQDC